MPFGIASFPEGGGLRQTENFISVLKPRPSREVAARKR